MTTATDSGALALAAFRRALVQSFGSGSPVRDEGYRQALSATVFRLDRYGIEETFAHYSARDLANMALVAGGSIVSYLMRTAYTRALVDNDGDLLAQLGTIEQVETMHAWLAERLAADQGTLAGMCAIAPASTDGGTDVPAEEVAVTRLVALRRFPDLLRPEWLWSIPADLPTVGYAMAADVLALRPELYGSVAEFLLRRRDVLLCREPDALLAPLVRIAGEHPQTVLAPFEGIYGEGTVVAAAEWHLEHDEPKAALELASGLRPLSVHAGRAALVAMLAALALGQREDARHFRSLIDDPADAALATVHLAERGADEVSDAELGMVLRQAPTTRPELFYRGLMCLLGRRRLVEARALAHARGVDFADHPQLGPIMAKVRGDA